VGEHELIQAEADADADDFGEAQKALQFRVWKWKNEF